ncbi:hypothetical protein D3C78_1618760 [compost metagenome]
MFDPTFALVELQPVHSFLVLSVSRKLFGQHQHVIRGHPILWIGHSVFIEQILIVIYRILHKCRRQTI